MSECSQDLAEEEKFRVSRGWWCGEARSGSDRGWGIRDSVASGRSHGPGLLMLLEKMGVTEQSHGGWTTRPQAAASSASFRATSHVSLGRYPQKGRAFSINVLRESQQLCFLTSQAIRTLTDFSLGVLREHKAAHYLSPFLFFSLSP